jgi:hypothetical protein
MTEHGYTSSFVYYTLEHKSLPPETDSILIKHVTSNIYREANVRILISLNNCLQGILVLTPIIEIITLYCILNIFLFELPSFLPHSSIPNRKSDWNFEK